MFWTFPLSLAQQEQTARDKRDAAALRLKRLDWECWHGPHVEYLAALDAAHVAHDEASARWYDAWCRMDAERRERYAITDRERA